MAIHERVVAHFMDGKVLKGSTRDFNPDQPRFHLDSASSSITIELRQIKAIFFVREFAGNAQRSDARGFMEAPREPGRGEKIAIRFRDGELLCGYNQTYGLGVGSFFLAPFDPASNNQRVFVMSHSAVEIGLGAEAEAMARRRLESDAA